jgi:hypothetical protein
MLYVFTTCALNFVPCAKLLARSVHQFIPDARMVLGLADRRPVDFSLLEEGFDEVLYLEDFREELGNPLGWAFGYSIMELSTAIKPFAACNLLERPDCHGILFFDADCVLFDTAPDLQKAVLEHSLVLTPHSSLLHERKEWLFFERNPLKVGAFNLGFFGVQNNELGRSLMRWWRFRLKDFCLIAPEEGLFTDQKWIDLIPSYIDDIKVMREPVYNLARWNTFQRHVTKENETYLVDGQPLQFVHFSGFYKIGPYVRGLYDRTSEPYVGNINTLNELSLWYSKSLDKARSQPCYSAPWALGFYGNDKEIVASDRRRYRESLKWQKRFPNPFDTSEFDNFWLLCRKQDRVDIERRWDNSGTIWDHVPRSVRAHNTILRQANEYLQERLVRAIAEGQVAADALQLLRTELVKVIGIGAKGVQQRRLSDLGQLLQSEGLFEPEEYLSLNPDVAQQNVNPLAHFLSMGLREGRQVNKDATSDKCVAQLAKCLLTEAASHQNIVEELLRRELGGIIREAARGLKQQIGDIGNALLAQGLFSPQEYLKANQDVAAARVDPLLHFLLTGLPEGRNGTANIIPEAHIVGIARVIMEQIFKLILSALEQWVMQQYRVLDEPARRQLCSELISRNLVDLESYRRKDPEAVKVGLNGASIQISEEMLGWARNPTLETVIRVLELFRCQLGHQGSALPGDAIPAVSTQ